MTPRITRRGLGLAAAGLALGAPGIARAQAITINLGHVLSATSAYQVIFERYKELAAQRTNGRVTVNIQGGGAAGNEGRLIQSLRTGVIDGAFVGGSSLETVVRDFRVLSLPYVFDDHPQANRVLQGAVGEQLLRELDSLGMIGLGFGAIFERNIASRRPVRTPADLQGLKIRVLQTPGFVEAYRVLGTQATPMAYGEVFLALQNGVVDALEISNDAIVADRFVEGRDRGRGGGDRSGEIGRQFAEGGVGFGRRLLLQADGADQDGREAFRADREQKPGAFGLRAPETVGGDLDGAERVGFGAGGLGHVVKCGDVGRQPPVPRDRRARPSTPRARVKGRPGAGLRCATG
ncbi:TRAP transporter substrate-binding protein [Leptolyngbya sp. 15MV]|nr:TRAP transporter substrate-binding protein [Leptolyngbya sp. 15MV]